MPDAKLLKQLKEKERQSLEETAKKEPLPFSSVLRGAGTAGAIIGAPLGYMIAGPVGLPIGLALGTTAGIVGGTKVVSRHGSKIVDAQALLHAVKKKELNEELKRRALEALNNVPDVADTELKKTASGIRVATLP